MQWVNSAWNWAGSAVSSAGSSGGSWFENASASDWLQLGGSALSSFSKFSAGMADERDAILRANEEELAASQELLRGAQTENALLDETIDILAKQRAAFAAAGVDAFTGTAAALARDTVRRGEQNQRIERQNARHAWRLRRQRAIALRQSGRAAGLGGMLDGAQEAVRSIASFVNRGN